MGMFDLLKVISPLARTQYNKLNPLASEQSRLLVVSLPRSCASSYNWNAKTFQLEMAGQNIPTYRAFERRSGTFSWRLAALVWTPVSYVLLLFSFFSFGRSFQLLCRPYSGFGSGPGFHHCRPSWFGC